MSQIIALRGMDTREAIADALYRCLLGLDNNDRQLFESSWSKDQAIHFDMGTGPMNGMDEILNMYNLIAPLVTQHNISNVRIDAEPGAKTAYMTAYAVAQHYRAGTGLDPTTQKLISGAYYFVDVVEDSDGTWRVTSWKIKFLWLDGDVSIVRP